MRISTCLLAFVLISLPVPALAEDWDLQAVKAASLGLASPPMDFAMTGLSFAPLTLGVPLLVALRGTPAAYRTAGTALVAELTGAAVSEGFKRVIRRQRPYAIDPSIRTPAGPESSYAMPSGHAALAFAGATVLAFDDPTLALPSYAFATAVGFSRIYLGVHYPSDILAGALLGTGVGLGVRAARDQLVSRGVLPAASPSQLGIKFSF